MNAIFVILACIVAVASASVGYLGDDLGNGLHRVANRFNSLHGYGYQYAPAVPYVAKPVSKGYYVGGDSAASAAYNYRNGYDRSNSYGARGYAHNAGYGFAAEGDRSTPYGSQWARRYSAAQSSATGFNSPQLYAIQTPSYGYAW